MTNEPDESRLWKYLSLPQIFQQKANEIDITCRQHIRICERLAGHLVRRRPKTAAEFEQVEYLKDFVVKSAELNERTIQLLGYLQKTIQEICNDARALKEGARMNATIRDQGEKIMKALDDLDTAEKLIRNGKSIS